MTVRYIVEDPDIYLIQNPEILQFRGDSIAGISFYEPDCLVAFTFKKGAVIVNLKTGKIMQAASDDFVIIKGFLNRRNFDMFRNAPPPKEVDKFDILFKITVVELVDKTTKVARISGGVV